MSSDTPSALALHTLVSGRFFTAQSMPTILRTSDGLLAIASDWDLSLVDPQSGLVQRTISGSAHLGPNLWTLDPTATVALRSDYRELERIDLATGEHSPIALPPDATRASSVMRMHCEPALEDRALILVNSLQWRFLSTKTWEFGLALEGSEYDSQQPLPRGAVCSTRGRRVALHSEHTLSLFDGERGRKLGFYSVQKEAIHCAAFSKDEREILVCTSAQLVTLDPDTAEVRSERALRGASALWGAFIARETGTLYGWTTDALYVFDLETLALRARHDVRWHPTEGFAFADRSAWVALFDGSVVRVDTEGLTQRMADASPMIDALAFDAEGKHVVIARKRAIAERVRLDDSHIERVRGLPHHWDAPEISPNATHVRWANGSVRLSDGAVHARSDEQAQGPRPKRDDRDEQHVTLIEGGVRLQSGEKSTDIAIEGFPTKISGAALNGAFSRNGRWFVANVGPRAAVIDTQSATVVASCKASSLHGVFVADNGVATARSYATVHVFGPDAKEQKVKLEKTTGMCSTLAPNRALVIAGLLDGALLIADATNTKRSARAPVRGGYPRALSVSPDESQLVVATGANDVVLVSMDELAALLPQASKPAKKRASKS